MRLNEAALHGWDVRVALDTDAALPASEAAIALDLLTGPLSFLLGFQAKTDILDGRQVTVRVVTTNPDRVLGLILRDKAELGDEPENADAVLTTPAEAFVRLLAGRLGPAHTPDAVTLTGDSVTLDQLRTCSRAIERLPAGLRRDRLRTVFQGHWTATRPGCAECPRAWPP